MEALDKSAIRKDVRRKRKQMKEEDFNSLSAKIYSYLFSPSFLLPECIGIYVSYKHEVDTIAIIQQLLNLHKRVFVPKIISPRQMDFIEIFSLNDLKENAMGIKEPCCGQKVDPCIIEMMITPLIAYNLKKDRIGQGGGFYDTLFAHYQGLKVGLAFSFQQYIFEVEEHDQGLDMIITDTGII